MEKQPLLRPKNTLDPDHKQSFLSIINPFKCFQRPHGPQDEGNCSLSNSVDLSEDTSSDFSEDDLSDNDNEPLPLFNAPVVGCSLSGKEKLVNIRKLMKEQGIAVYIVPSEDEHQSEYTSQADKRREYLCGFTGSAGICVVTLDDGDSLEGEAALSTDGRYFLQAEKELDFDHWRLLKQGTIGYPSWQEFAMEKAVKSSFSNKISVDPKFMSLQTGQRFASALSIRGFNFAPFSKANLVDQVWGTERPTRSLDSVYEYTLEYSGETTESKLTRVRAHLKGLNATHLVVTALDDIGWLLNLRADTDIPFSPFFFAYVIVSHHSVTLYANSEKLKRVSSYLNLIIGLKVKPYDQFYTDIGSFKSTVGNSDIKLVLPGKDACNYALFSSIPSSITKQTIIYDSVISVMKLTKNRVELLNAKVAQAKDSLVFILLSSWLEHALLSKELELNEYQVAEKIYNIRKRFPNFKGLSYETIASTGPNAAVIHYAPSEDKSSPIDIKTPFLLDSGAHFLEGTTDITRTYKFGNDGPMHLYRKFYTLVLKGHLSVALAKFIDGNTATGTILDAYARQPLWNEGLDYNHGTGHGVGSFGNVHEGPLYILTTAGGVSSQDYFKKGAILTDEPGYYVDGSFGFRVESELEIYECSGSFGKARNGKNYLGFKYLTRVPFCRNLIDVSLLTKAEIKWINDYHRSIRDEFGPKLLHMGEKRAFKWLKKETEPL